MLLKSSQGMNKQIENNIAKVLANEATHDEIKIVEDWKNENQTKYNNYKRAFSANIFESTKFGKKVFNERVAESNISKTTYIRLNTSVLYKIAVVFFGLAIIGSLYFYNKSLTIVFTNSNNSLAYITLPDNSQVTLAPESIIKYKKGWFNTFNREVELVGKAYFEISKSKVNTFIVSTSKLSVTVLGTKFMVNELDNKTQIVLSEGKVSLKGSAIKTNLIIDKPGSQVIVNKKNVLINDVVDNELYASWLNNKIHFNNCTVNQVINMLYNSYDLRIELSNKELGSKRLFGTAPSDDPELIVDALSHILNTNLVTQTP